MQQMQDIRRSIGKEELPFPKCFYASDDEGVIVLQNLKEIGFKTVPKSAEGNFGKCFIKLFAKLLKILKRLFILLDYY